MLECHTEAPVFIQTKNDGSQRLDPEEASHNCQGQNTNMG